ncbi:helix-turn-helix transcriptional regulator [Mycolicibacterium agri]|uniref:Helix-turn-helix transcriptional regulator n=1 Tax=Mycolicibacterium agri TaxID=36811 RepID=A0A2A7MQN2_MYCAG|nr:isoniazid response ATPase/transcriptional regulator IniR [Mycolicibacterium agri]PEG34006.1 helix-turn-helix transcriptional regulator [Mycolicibacterium agri]GFG52919.1 LuxR family transcriptional regulator [Mycolicibacterium agri]
MAGPAPDALTDIPPAAREAVSTLIAAPAEPVRYLVSGGIGTGKSSVLAAARTALRSAAVPVLTRAPRPGDDPAAAVVIDDAHLLADEELEQLVARVSDSTSTVMIAAEPLTQAPALRVLSTALGRENPVIALGALSGAEVADEVRVVTGIQPPAEVVRALMVSTAGLPFLLRPAIAAVASPSGDGIANAVADAARFALIERLRRLDEPVLDTMLVLSLSPDLGPDDVAAALRFEPGQAQRLVDRARASGLIEPSHNESFLTSVHLAVAQIIGALRHHDVEIALLCSQIELTTLTADLALRMADHGLRDDRLANALADLAAHSRSQPAKAARLYRAAAAAGATAVSTRLADALALTGDCTTASRLTDDLLASDDPAERAAAVRIAASIAAHDGSAAQAAELFRWLGPYPDAFVGAANAIVSIAAGDAEAARAALSTESAGPPTSTARAAQSLAAGLLLSLDQPFPVAVARLGQAITSEQHPPGVAPDSPAALVTLAALHGGDPVRARSVIGRAVRAGAEDDVFSAYRHRLLLGWVRMQDGQLASATADSAAVADASLHRRDALWAAALNTAIARRSGDGGAVQKHWYAAMEVLAEYSVDLFSLLPLGELWVAAARMRLVDRLQHTLDEAFALLKGLGDPVLWSVPLHWAGVHAGILANSPEAVAPHGHALTAAAGQSAFAKALAAAGRTWLRVLANHVDADEVTAAARLLSQFGLTWDATRLAGQAALQTPDGRVSSAMLQLARDLKLTVAVDDDAGVESAPATATSAGSSRPSSRLSEREREVAELLLLGMPYRDIGAQLFISAKTVEHHVARIRRRLGAESRSEMLSMLRAMLSMPNQTDSQNTK